MDWLKKLFGAISGYFHSGKAAADAQMALNYIGKALPYLKIAADIIIGITPTTLDDIAWNGIQKRYPSLFDGNTKTDDELKALAFLIASDLMKAKYPELSTTVARAAVQLAYIDHKADPVASAEASVAA